MAFEIFGYVAGTQGCVHYVLLREACFKAKLVLHIRRAGSLLMRNLNFRPTTPASYLRCKGLMRAVRWAPLPTNDRALAAPSPINPLPHVQRTSAHNNAHADVASA